MDGQKSLKERRETSAELIDEEWSNEPVISPGDQLKIDLIKHYKDKNQKIPDWLLPALKSQLERDAEIAKTSEIDEETSQSAVSNKPTYVFSFLRLRLQQLRHCEIWI